MPLMRSEGDSWDITSSVGATALSVATARALEARKPDPLAVDPYAELFCRAAEGDWRAVVEGNCPDHRLLSADFGEPFVNYQGARTRFFDDYFRSAADAGVRQVVLLAAGLDSRAFRLSWPEGTTIFELDQPQVLAFKSYVLSQRGIRAAAARHEVAVDLREDWPAALREAGFDPAQPSAWIVEGLLFYLPGDAQEQLFTGINGLTAPGSQVAIEEGIPMPDEVFKAAVQAEIAAGDDRRNFHRLIYNERCAPADQWFGDRGWAATATPLADYLAQMGRPVPDLGTEAGQMVARNVLVHAVKR